MNRYEVEFVCGYWYVIDMDALGTESFASPAQHTKGDAERLCKQMNEEECGR